MSGTKASAMNAMTRRRSRAKRGANPAEFLTYEKTRPLTRTVRLDDRSVARPRRARRPAEAFAKVTGSFRGEKQMSSHSRFALLAAVIAAIVLLIGVTQTAVATTGNVRLTNDTASSGGYVSAYTLATGIPYTDDIIKECSISGGRQNEPAAAIDPRDTNAT